MIGLEAKEYKWLFHHIEKTKFSPLHRPLYLSTWNFYLYPFATYFLSVFTFYLYLVYPLDSYPILCRRQIWKSDFCILQSTPSFCNAHWKIIYHFSKYFSGLLQWSRTIHMRKNWKIENFLNSPNSCWRFYYHRTLWACYQKPKEFQANFESGRTFSHYFGTL